MKHILVVICLLLGTYGCSPANKCDQGQVPGSCIRILFIGNSYTFTNDLPAMFSKLSNSGGHKVETGLSAQGGWTLTDHLNSPATLERISSSKWDYVILQEQSEIPAMEQSRTVSMYPAARVLVQQIKKAGATPIFFLTWAHRDGWPENGFNDYQSMQFQIDIGYMGIARELSVPIAPVGYSWLLSRIQDPKLDLWQQDGSHPTETGTYLAACVFYSVIFRETSKGLSYKGNLDKETAQLLQQIAASTVLDNPAQWNISKP